MADEGRAWALDCARGRKFGALYVAYARRTEAHYILAKIAAAMTPETAAVQVGFWTEVSGSL